MAQIGNSEIVSMAIGKLEISTNGSAWTDVSGYGFAVEAGGGERMQGVQYTLDGDTGLITAGKQQPFELNIKGLYTEDGSAPFATVWTQYQTAGGGDLYARWSPKAGASGDDLFTTSVGIVTACLPPGTDPESPDPTPFAFTLVVASITKSTIA